MSHIPSFKRIKISCPQDLDIWLTKHPQQTEHLMIVTYGKASAEKHVSRDQVQAAILKHGWAIGPTYTLNAHLIGHVIHNHKHRP